MVADRALSLKAALCPAGTVLLEPWPVELVLIKTAGAVELQMLVTPCRNRRIVRCTRDPLKGVTCCFRWVHFERCGIE